MTTVSLSEHHAGALALRAFSGGLSLEAWLEKLAKLEIESSAHLQKTNPEGWAQRFQAFLDSQDPHTPVLSGEAMSRESIYR